MARVLLHRYWDIPEGTECHRKAYASTSISGAVGEPRPAGPGEQRVQGGHRVTGGCPRVSCWTENLAGWYMVVVGVSLAALELWRALVRDKLCGVSD